MEQLLKASELTKTILASVTNSAAASALIAKWSDKDLGPNPIATAAALEARNQVFGWGR